LMRPTTLPQSTAFLPEAYVGVCPTCGGAARQADRYPRAVCLVSAESATCAAHLLPVALGGDGGGLLGGLEPGHLDTDGRWDCCTRDGAVLVNGVRTPRPGTGAATSSAAGCDQCGSTTLP
jgi:hypothetical protein